ncbi:MAG: HAMP domain-containing sensor histidine kinase [Cyanobacteria bacterium P01_D01_bin.128]
MVLVSMLGIGGISFWVSWRMQQILLEAPKAATLDVIERFEGDVIIYQEMEPSTLSAVQKVVEHRSTGDLVLWLRDRQGQLIAQSESMQLGSWQTAAVTQQLLARQSQSQLEVVTVNGRHFVLCVNPVRVNGNPLGTLHIAKDITQAQRSFNQVNRSLIAVNLGALVAIAIALIIYIRRALSPIRQINQLAAEVSAENLGDAQLKLDQAPTEVRELAQTLERMLLRLAQAWEYQQRFVNDVSHELRTPLSLVNGYLQSTLRRCSTLTDMQREGLEIAATETERTIRLLQDLLDLARADSGALRFNLERTDPQFLIKEIIEMAAYSDRAIDLQLMPTAEIRVDRQRLKQILINLIDNALQYSKDASPIHIGLSQSDTTVNLWVSDHGRGISLSEQTAIFKPFYRVDADRSRQTGGTGLGLSIVKRLVESMGGAITVHSKLGAGSTFTLRFPTCY